MAILFKRSNGVYYICYVTEGKRLRKSRGERLQSSALKKMLQFDSSPKSEKPKATLEAFIADFLSHSEGSFAPKTVELYRRTLTNFHALCGNKKLEAVTPRDVDLFVSHRMKRLSPVSVNIEIRTLRAAFNTALRWRQEVARSSLEGLLADLLSIHSRKRIVGEKIR
jgi:Phage integrase, N-terminal SAM-like domain